MWKEKAFEMIYLIHPLSTEYPMSENILENSIIANVLKMSKKDNCWGIVTQRSNIIRTMLRMARR